jgi:hypothetical protein
VRGKVVGHDRDPDLARVEAVIRRLKAAAAPWLPFPHADQALQIVRRRRTLRTGKVSIERVYAITSLTAHQANAADLAERVRGHWAIENREHHVRDVTFGEGRNAVISLLLALTSRWASTMPCLPPTYAGRLFDAQAAGATEQQLQRIAAEGLQEIYFKDRGRRAHVLEVEFTDIDYVELDF